MKVTITKKILKQHKACALGIKNFLSVFPNGIEVKYTNEVQLGILMHPKLRRYFGWAAKHGLISPYSMSGLNLSNIDLSYANLEGIDLSGAILNNSNLEGCNLENTNMRKADLRKTILRLAWVKNANFDGAILDETDFRGTNLDLAINRGESK